MPEILESCLLQSMCFNDLSDEKVIGKKYKQKCIENRLKLDKNGESGWDKKKINESNETEAHQRLKKGKETQ